MHVDTVWCTLYNSSHVLVSIISAGQTHCLKERHEDVNDACRYRMVYAHMCGCLLYPQDKHIAFNVCMCESERESET